MLKRRDEFPGIDFTIGLPKCVMCHSYISTSTKIRRPGQKYCSDKCRGEAARFRRKISPAKEPAYLSLRFNILARDNFTCQYCGKTPQDGAKLVVDHINPQSNGGKSIETNLVTACQECNGGKKDILLTERQSRKLRLGK